MEKNYTKEDLERITTSIVNYSQLEKPISDKTFSSSDRQIFSKDYSRVLYSNSFKRLQGKMQFLSVTSNQFYRNRLTHSQEVLQIARTIAGALKQQMKDKSIEGFNLYNIDMYVIETACLAHDIGNPPFGHAGERMLNDLMDEFGGYEGNAQTFRVLNRLERRFPNEEGLFLSKRSLLSVVKYSNSRYSPDGKKNNKFLYDDDFEVVKKISEETDVKIRTLDAQIMDIADEIAYAAHDLEDALRQKLFTIEDLIFEFNNSKDSEGNYDYRSAKSTLEEIVEKSKEVAQTCTSQSSEDYYFFFLKELTSRIVDSLINDIGLVEVTEKDREESGTSNEFEIGYKKLERLSSGLKKLTFKCLLRKPEVVLYEKNGEKIIKGLFQVFTDKKFNKNSILLPPEYRNPNYPFERNVCDYISGMMDIYAMDTYKKYFGEKSLDGFYR